MHRLIHVDIDNDTVSELCEMLMETPPENSRAVNDLRVAVHQRWPLWSEREAVLDKVTKHAAGVLCELLAAETAKGDANHFRAIHTTMLDDTAGISFQTMMADAIYTTVKGIIDE